MPLKKNTNSLPESIAAINIVFWTGGLFKADNIHLPPPKKNRTLDGIILKNISMCIFMVFWYNLKEEELEMTQSHTQFKWKKLKVQISQRLPFGQALFWCWNDLFYTKATRRKHRHLVWENFLSALCVYLFLYEIIPNPYFLNTALHNWAFFFLPASKWFPKGD